MVGLPRSRRVATLHVSQLNCRCRTFLGDGVLRDCSGVMILVRPQRSQSTIEGTCTSIPFGKGVEMHGQSGLILLSWPRCPDPEGLTVM